MGCRVVGPPPPRPEPRPGAADCTAVEPLTPVRELRPTDAMGFAFAGWALASTVAGWWLATRASIVPWAAGQTALAAAFLQWFALLHECGHGTLFRTRRLNTLVGSIAGLFALIPFRCWKPIHARHHKWTGWQDLDPTTAALVPRPLGRFERFAVNVCWRYWIPIFSVLYRTGNYWNLVRLFRLLGPQPAAARAMAVEAVVLAAAWIAVVVALGPADFLRTAGLALFLSLVVEDVILLSQHTHMPMRLSRGREVEPYGALAQGPFTRSLRLPGWLSRMLLHFDAHELHHLHPAVPGYRLRELRRPVANEVGWAEWVPAARAVPGEVFLFQNRNQSGFDV